MPQAQQVRQSQGQSVSQKQITHQQSFECVKTMVEAGLGCVTYLRGLLVDGHFVDDGVNVPPPGKKGSTSSQKLGDKSFKVKRIKEHFSPEGDRLLSYLGGVYDAVERQFLRSMVFSIYLDPNEPSNVVETYTFNFSYLNVPGVGTVPIMDVERQMGAMSVGAEFDPIENGKALTVGEVKKRVKNLIKNLIVMTQMLEELPRKRCIALKLFYNETAPADYEPPMFRPAKREDRLYFGTRGQDEEPEISEVGGAHTGYHGVSITIRSIVGQLPRKYDAEDNELPFGETQPAIEGDPAELKARDQEAVEEDALNRTILWNAEEQIEDRSALRAAAGDPEPESSPKSTVRKPIFNAAFAEKIAPNRYAPFTTDEMAKMASKHKKRVAEHPKEDVETPSSQQATQMLAAKKKHGEGDRGHAVRESREKLRTLADPPRSQEDSQRWPETQQIGLAALDSVEVDEDEPSFIEGPSMGDETPGEPSSSRSARPKSKFQPLMPAHREENEHDIAETQIVAPKTTAGRPSGRQPVEDDAEDPIASFSTSNEGSPSIEVDKARSTTAVTSSAPAAPGGSKGAKKNVRMVVDSDDDMAEPDRASTQKKTTPQQPKKKSTTKKTTKPAAKPKPKKKSTTATGNGSTAGASRAASTAAGGSQPKKSHKKGAGRAATHGGKGKKKAVASDSEEIEVDADGKEVDPALQKLQRQCWCGDHAADGPEAVCDKCDLWMHLHCHGAEDAQSVKDIDFFCAKCELKADPRTQDWDVNQIEDAIQGFRTLALFRRTLILVRDKGLIENLAKLGKLLVCSTADAQLMLNRLEDEGFVRRVNEKSAAAVLSSQPTKRRGFEAVKNKTTRKAMKDYFDRKSRKLEHKAWGIADGDHEEEHARAQSMEVDDDIPQAQPVPGPSSFQPPTQPLIDFTAEDDLSSDSQPQTQFQPARRAESLSVSQVPRTPSRALSNSSTHNLSPPIAIRSSYEADFDVDGQTQMQPARAPSSPSARRRSSTGDGDVRMSSTGNENDHPRASPSGSGGSASSSKGKRKAVEMDEDVDGDRRAMSLAEAMEVTGAAELGQSKKMRASISEAGVDISY